MSSVATAGRVNIAIAVADSLARRKGRDPVAEADHFARTWAKATLAEQREFLVVHCGMRPDPVVFRQFVEALQGRADRMRGKASS